MSLSISSLFRGGPRQAPRVNAVITRKSFRKIILAWTHLKKTQGDTNPHPSILLTWALAFRDLNNSSWRQANQRHLFSPPFPGASTVSRGLQHLAKNCPIFGADKKRTDKSGGEKKIGKEKKYRKIIGPFQLTMI